MSNLDSLRVLYVEDDPALRGILSHVVGSRPAIDIVHAVGKPADALAFVENEKNLFDVALLDLSLGEHEMTGIELGIRICRIRPKVGIALLSQYSVPDFITRVPKGLRRGWSFIAKKSDLNPNYIVDVLQATAKGLNILDPNVVEYADEQTPSILSELSLRQQEVLSLVASGRDATGIASDLGITVGAVRQELSKSYHILVPNPPPGTDLRTSAVLRFLRESRESHSPLES